MKKLIGVFGVLALLGAATGCSEHHRVTSTTRETVETAPMDPVVTEKHTTTHVETRTGD